MYLVEIFERTRNLRDWLKDQGEIIEVISVFSHDHLGPCNEVVVVYKKK